MQEAIIATKSMKGRKMNLTIRLTTEQAIDNRSALRQTETSRSGLSVRTHLRAGNPLIGGDTQQQYAPPPTQPDMGYNEVGA